MSAPLSSLPSSEEEELMARSPSKLCKIYYKQRYKHLASINKEKLRILQAHGGYIKKRRQPVTGQDDNQKIAETFKHCLCFVHKF